MDVSEYLAFLPLLIYGIAISDLFAEWKRLLEPKGVFVPYILFTIMLTEVAVYNVFAYAELVDDLKGLPYHSYLIKLFPPFLFMLTVNAFTPDKGADTKSYFMKQMPVFFGLLAVFMTTHFFFDYGEDLATTITRAVGVAVTLVTGFSRKTWLTYVMFAFWILFIYFRSGYTVSL